MKICKLNAIFVYIIPYLIICDVPKEGLLVKGKDYEKINDFLQ